MRLAEIILIFSSMFLQPVAARCGEALGESATAVSGTAVADSSFSVDELPLPSVPSSLTVPSARAAYIVEHFWDGLDFRDTLRSRSRVFMERSFSTYASLFPHARAEALPPAISGLMMRASADKAAYRLLCVVAEKYLYEKGSPVYNEECFMMFLEEMSNLPAGGEAVMSRASFLLEAARKNRRGTVAADFAYTTRNGGRHTFHATPGDTLLLMFYDPDCRHCMETVGRLDGSVVFCNDVATGRLTVLAVCVDTSDSRWRSTVDSMPDGWIVANDASGIPSTGLYDLPSMPVMYLIGKEKRVIAKEISAKEIIEFLE